MPLTRKFGCFYGMQNKIIKSIPQKSFRQNTYKHNPILKENVTSIYKTNIYIEISSHKKQ